MLLMVTSEAADERNKLLTKSQTIAFFLTVGLSFCCNKRYLGAIGRRPLALRIGNVAIVLKSFPTASETDRSREMLKATDESFW